MIIVFEKIRWCFRREGLTFVKISARFRREGLTFEKIRWCFRREVLTFAKKNSEKIAVYVTWSADVSVVTRVIF